MKRDRNPFAKTKIVCTLGPASQQPKTIAAMIHAGMDAARINFSHGIFKEHLDTFRTLKKVARALGRPITVIQDLQGPKIRIGDLAAPSVNLISGQVITLTTKDEKGTEKRLSTTYRHLPKDVKRGNRILLDDGKIELRVIGIRNNEVSLKVVTGGQLTAHKGINLPGVTISEPSLTEKDKEDLEFSFEHDIDYIALSFVRRAQDIAVLRDYISKNVPKGKEISIIAKIEKGEAISNIDEILKAADAVMVARGDLGVELPTEEIPILQKMIVRKCNELGKPVIIATQMLESMIANPRPTRAEASDVANAVLDGADAVMLSGETSIGKYPVDAVRVMDNIIRKAEEQIKKYRHYNPNEFSSTHEYDSLCRSACVLAENLNAETIVSVTHSGTTAMRVAKYRPAAKIIAVTSTEKYMRKLNLIWGIRGLVVKNLKKDTDATFKKIEQQLLKEGYIKHGETIVMLAGLPLFEGHPTNAIKVDKV